MKHDNWSPNDYNISLTLEDIPSNIGVRTSADLTRELQRVTPLGRRVHLDIGNREEQVSNHILLNTHLKVNGVDIL